MRREIIQQLINDVDYYYFLKEKPVWIKILSIYPNRLKDFLEDYKVIRKKRMIDKIDDVNVFLNLAETFLKK